MAGECSTGNLLFDVILAAAVVVLFEVCMFAPILISGYKGGLWQALYRRMDYVKNQILTAPYSRTCPECGALQP